MAPKTEAEWQRLGNQLLDSFRAGDFPGIIQEGQAIGRPVILMSPGHYLPAACIANALKREERFQESLDYFETALPLNSRDVYPYCDAIRASGEYQRGLAFLHRLAELRPNDLKQINEAVAYLSFFSTVAGGDERYLAGDKGAALSLYQEASRQFNEIPADVEQQRAFISGLSHSWDEYTYLHAYDTPDGANRSKYLVGSFLKPKLELCRFDEMASFRPTIVRVAILIVRNSAFPYVVGNKTLLERGNLDDTGVARRKASWMFATDAVEMYSGGKIKIQTTYIDLPNVTVTRIHDWVWKGLVHDRHLDPAGLAPSQSALFGQLVRSYDVIVFAWCGGAGALSYGGGPVALPGGDGPLPPRGCIKRMPIDACSCLHELLHNFEGRAFRDRVHGPQNPSWDIQAANYRMNDELDWYAHLVSEIHNPQSARYTKP